jgi:hypothetical protein
MAQHEEQRLEILSPISAQRPTEPFGRVWRASEIEPYVEEVLDSLTFLAWNSELIEASLEKLGR